jgi:hypothetical protein
LGLVGVVVFFVVLTVVISRLPTGTSAGSLALRAGAAFAAGLGLIVVVRRALGAMGDPPPAPPLTVDAGPADVVYECTVCGTRVRLEVAATGKPPKHCGEEMVAKVSL